MKIIQEFWSLWSVPTPSLRIQWIGRRLKRHLGNDTLSQLQFWYVSLKKLRLTKYSIIQLSC